MRSEIHHAALPILLTGVLLSVVAFAAEPGAPATKPSNAKICLNCHKAEFNVIRAHFDNVTFKARTIQVKIDDATELIKFDEDEIKVVSAAGKTGDGDLLKDNNVKKGHEIKIVYVEKEGVKTAVKLVAKPPVKISADMLLSTADVERLVALGPEKGKYFLFDSRPLPRFQEGAIPTAVNLPYPAFDKLAGTMLPKDRDSLVIFYCSGPTCNMSPGSAEKAKKLGYTNLKVYKDGMPVWSVKNYGVLTAQFLKEAWIDRDIPHVLLDVRESNNTVNGFIKGAVAFPAGGSAAVSQVLPPKDVKPPIIIYDDKDGKQAEKVAKELLKAGYGKVMVLNGGFNAWQSATFDITRGPLLVKALYTPRLRAGEINLDEFKKITAELPVNTVIIDVRTAEEGNAGMLKTAKLIPAEELKDRRADIPKDKLIVLYCNTGVIAEMAYHTLKELGYINVKFVSAKLEFDKNGSYKLSKE